MLPHTQNPTVGNGCYDQKSKSRAEILGLSEASDLTSGLTSSGSLSQCFRESGKGGVASASVSPTCVCNDTLNVVHHWIQT